MFVAERYLYKTLKKFLTGGLVILLFSFILIGEQTNAQGRLPGTAMLYFPISQESCTTLGGLGAEWTKFRVHNVNKPGEPYTVYSGEGDFSDETGNIINPNAKEIVTEICTAGTGNEFDFRVMYLLRTDIYYPEDEGNTFVLEIEAEAEDSNGDTIVFEIDDGDSEFTAVNIEDSATNGLVWGGHIEYTNIVNCNTSDCAIDITTDQEIVTPTLPPHLQTTIVILEKSNDLVNATVNVDFISKTSPIPSRKINDVVTRDSSGLKRFELPPATYDIEVEFIMPDGSIEKEILDNVKLVAGETKTYLFALSAGGVPVISLPSDSPSNVGLEACAGSLSCANCIGRYATYNAAGEVVASSVKPFTTFQEAAQAQLDGNIVYTNYFYTSLGCIDPSPDGIVVRLIQIALGISGFVILVRFGQAAFMLQKGDPEAYQEGISIAWSALLALIMIVLAVSGFAFLGVNVFKVLPPGTIEIDNS